MASLSRDPSGRRIIQFTAPRDPTKRHSVRLGKIGQRAAEEVRRHVEYLVAAQSANAPIDASTAAWLDRIGDTLRARLAAVGLCEVARGANLGPWLDAYCAGRVDLKNKGSKAALVRAATRLKEHFGPDTDMRAIGEHDARQWLVHEKSKRSLATVGRDVIFARAFWTAAIRQGVVRSNPFSGLKAPGQTNDERHRFIDHAASVAILEACGTWQLRLVFALARWGGLRIPSEVSNLTWADVLWDKRQLQANGKTGPRWLPLFPELDGPLSDAWEHAAEGEHRVLPRTLAGSSLAYQLERTIHRCGFTKWPRLWHNLRSTRQTELEDAGFPSYVVARWLGNSPTTARKHYLQLTDHHFQKALQKAVQPTPEGAANGGFSSAPAGAREGTSESRRH